MAIAGRSALQSLAAVLLGSILLAPSRGRLLQRRRKSGRDTPSPLNPKDAAASTLQLVFHTANRRQSSIKSGSLSGTECSKRAFLRSVKVRDALTPVKAPNASPKVLPS
eukprot:CAMPEP_0206547416 /NCGR_PEP_ID=MMETSP0325_2-20121206/13282_1 /ASSEMBLY_ACC=CAM_ASM_000347 /TAXON_ID=2866 /ORGANISM="Crypthecodinium cohnii, Strain Seligo" /LENGTH=108 /DNA_ID=CAMNT_0054046715 /DNA_START=233 /DNA_END=560 /DNA_ORIENTATION=+